MALSAEHLKDSTRDGMNLVSYEYVACHNAKAVQASRESIAPGVLVLSQFAGAAGVLQGALVVNPWDAEGCAAALVHAVNMCPAEARIRMQELGNKVEEHTSRRWGFSFLRALACNDAGDDLSMSSVSSVSSTSSEDEGLVLDLRKASSRLGRVDRALS
ncbi:Trehalose-6-P synthase/phosphatase complex synthase subunit [Recurvomyces mirabilis]|nr:Trehalose-6-P synthase/phosphatase complex synthase subunit [Recurvomyces mirabilis]